MPRRRRAGVLLMAIAALAAPPLPAETPPPLDLFELDLEDLVNVPVLAATKTDEKSALAPSVVTVITAQDIAAYGYESVAEALSHVAGFVETSDLVLHNFGVRGVNAGARAGSRILKFMIDGQPVGFRATSQNFIDRELIPMDMVERIEVVRGPVSALYGADAFLGTVNVVTRAPRGEGRESRVTLGTSRIESAGRGRAWSITTTDGQGAWDYRLGLSAADIEREGLRLPRISPLFGRLVPPDGSRPAALSDEAHPASLYGRLGYRLSARSTLELSLHYQELDAENPFSDLNPLRSTGVSRVALSNGFLRADYRTGFGADTKAHVYASYARGRPLAGDRIEVGARDFFLERNFGYESLDLGADLLFPWREADSLLLGFDLTRDDETLESFTRVQRGDGSRHPLNPDRVKRLDNRGLYGQWQFQFSERWRGILGYRSDEHSQYGRQESLRAGLVGRLDHDAVVKLLAGSAFQAPSPELSFRHAVQAGDIIGNPELRAQEARTLELSASMPLTEWLHGSATAFLTKVDDLVTFETDGVNLLARNGSSSRTRGVELELRAQRSPWSAYGNYTWQRTARADNPHSLFVLNQAQAGELFPEHSANLGLSYNYPAWRLTLSLDNRYVGARPASTANVLSAQQFYALSPYRETTLSVATQLWSLVKGAEGRLGLELRDARDEDYVNGGFGGIDFPTQGRRYSLNFHQRF